MSNRGVAQRSHKPAQVQPVLDWQELAECRDVDPDLFHDRDRVATALLVCRGCPVQEPCRQLRHSAQGVWGGRAYYPRTPRRRVAS